MKYLLTHRIGALATGLILASFAPALTTFGQGTALTYQGRLNDGAALANGTYDLRFGLFDAPVGGTPQSSTITSSGTVVTNGLFTVTLDFGNAFTGADRWLEIAVRTNGGGYTILAPRQAITATPYAIRAGNVSGPVAASQIAGTLPLAQLPVTLLTNGASGVNLTGAFTGSGAGLTSLNLALNSGGAITWPGNFVPGASASIAGTAYALTTADVNGDGKQDIITANFSTDSLSVLTNNGSGTYVLASSPATGGQPFAVVTVDVNGDGKLDLVSANSGSSTVSVLINNGNGVFTLASTPSCGATPYYMTTGDVNGDGKPDLITSDFNANTLTILTNSGNGIFALAATLPTDSQPTAVVAADLNRDGKVDLAVANANVNTVWVYTNSGNGTFGFSGAAGTGNRPVSMVAADMNGDGKLDLITANNNNSTITVQTNNGNAGLVIAYQRTVGTGPNTVTAADINGDGKPDVITANYNGGTLTVLTNDGTGLALGSTVATSAYAATAADMNGDGRADLISVSSATASVWLNQATITGRFAGDGSGLTSVPAGSLTGTIPDARLSPNVALRSGGNAFTGTQTISGGNLGIGITPQSTLDVNGTARIEGANNWGVSGGEGDFRVGNDAYRFKIGVANGGSGAGDVWMRAHGGTQRIFLKSPGGLQMFSNEAESAGVALAANATAWSVISDRNAKKDFAAIDTVQILEKLAAMPITQWHYKWESPETTPHIGPMAQDFKAAFYPGTDDKSITTLEADGVALAAIQGLNHKLEEQRAANAKLQQEVTELKQLLQKLLSRE